MLKLNLKSCLHVLVLSSVIGGIVNGQTSRRGGEGQTTPLRDLARKVGQNFGQTLQDRLKQQDRLEAAQKVQSYQEAWMENDTAITKVASDLAPFVGAVPDETTSAQVVEISKALARQVDIQSLSEAIRSASTPQQIQLALPWPLNWSRPASAELQAQLGQGRGRRGGPSGNGR